MKCVYCQGKAGFFKKTCSDCRQLVMVISTAPDSFGYRELLEKLIATGVAPEKIEKFLDTDVEGGGTINDQITARMTNEVMTSLGQPSALSGRDVKKVREDIAAGNPPSAQDREHEH